MILELKTYPSTKETITGLRDNLAELVDYMRNAGRLPTTVHAFASSYNAAVRSANADARRKAKADARAAEQMLRAAGKKGPAAKVQPEPDLVEAVTFDGIRVEPIGYSRPRPVTA